MEIDLSALDAVIAAGEGGTAGGTPILLPLDLIDEDVHQPRTEFSEDALQELATTIAERGVRQPISVRSHPGVPGRWMVNFGARRLRASRLAGRADIPAFVDETADSYDQVIENEQREGLQPLELALFIERRLRAGDSQAEVARRLGKSRMYVTYLCSLIDAPEWLLTLYRNGICRGISELHEIRKLSVTDSADLRAWLTGREAITRSDLKSFKQGRAQGQGLGQPLRGPQPSPDTVPHPATLAQQPLPNGREDARPIDDSPTLVPDSPADPLARQEAPPSSSARCPTRFLARWGPVVVELVPDLLPSDSGRIAVRDPDAGTDAQGRRVQWVNVSELILDSVVPAKGKR